MTLNNVTLNILSTLTFLGLGFIFIGMPILGLVAWYQSHKKRLAGHN
jgi:hypothetical protein